MLAEAISYCHRRSFVLVAASRCRFVRSTEFYDKKPRQDVMSQKEYRALKRMAEGVTLATLAHPNSSGRSEQTSRGIGSKGAKVGRPRKLDTAPGWTKRRKASLIRTVKKLHWNETPFRKIQREVNAKSKWRPVRLRRSTVG